MGVPTVQSCQFIPLFVGDLTNDTEIGFSQLLAPFDFFIVLENIKVEHVLFGYALEVLSVSVVGVPKPNVEGKTVQHEVLVYLDIIGRPPEEPLRAEDQGSEVRNHGNSREENTVVVNLLSEHQFDLSPQHSQILDRSQFYKHFVNYGLRQEGQQVRQEQEMHPNGGDQTVHLVLLPPEMDHQPEGEVEHHHHYHRVALLSSRVLDSSVGVLNKGLDAWERIGVKVGNLRIEVTPEAADWPEHTD